MLVVHKGTTWWVDVIVVLFCGRACSGLMFWWSCAVEERVVDILACQYENWPRCIALHYQSEGGLYHKANLVGGCEMLRSLRWSEK